MRRLESNKKAGQILMFTVRRGARRQRAGPSSSPRWRCGASPRRTRLRSLRRASSAREAHRRVVPIQLGYGQSPMLHLFRASAPPMNGYKVPARTVRSTRADRSDLFSRARRLCAGERRVTCGAVRPRCPAAAHRFRDIVWWSVQKCDLRCLGAPEDSSICSLPAPV
jgi:hypothetical protein